MMHFLWEYKFHLLVGTLLALAMVAVCFALFQIVCGPKIVSVLVLKYLRKRRIAWVSLIAVMLCTWMVLVVISVMGGWLRMFEQSFRGLTGDIIVDANSMQGFPYYQEMIDEIKGMQGVHEAVPVIEAYGLINIGNQKSTGVQVLGYQIDKIGGVNEFPKSLWRGYNSYLDQAKNPALTPDQRKQLLIDAEEHSKHPTWDKPLADEDYRLLVRWKEGSRGSDPATWPSMIAGSGVLNIGPGPDGVVTGRSDVLYELPVKLTVLGTSADFTIDINNKAERTYWLVDDSHTKVYQYDSNYVYVPFEQLQADCGMAEIKFHNKITDKEDVTPARASEVHVRIAPGIDLEGMKAKIQDVVNGVLVRHASPTSRLFSPRVVTWEDTQRPFLNAVKNEKSLLVVLFGVISVVAIFLIFCIFYMIVAEKTKDIGIIKSVGATANGVAGIFLGYGLVIGIVGAGLGLLGSYLVVTYINEIHGWMGRKLHLVVWDPQMYIFDKIPNTMDPVEVVIIVTIAVVASVIGALLPAIRAARMNPVEALRWE